MPDALAKPVTHIHRPPLVKGLPLLGSSIPLLKNPHEFVKQAYKTYGDVFRFEAGPRKFVVIGGVDANRFVTGKGPHNCLGASLSELIMPLHMGLMLYHLEFRPACDLNKVKVIFNPAPVLSDNFKVRVSLRHAID